MLNYVILSIIILKNFYIYVFSNFNSHALRHVKKIIKTDRRPKGKM